MEYVKKTPVVIVKGYADPTKSIFFSARTWILMTSGTLLTGFMIMINMAK